jgi:ATP-binding cassette, subfamily B, bacterial
MANPYVNLLATSWHYAKKEKRRYLLVYGAFILTNLINATRPWLYGWFINAIQKEGLKVLQHSWIYVGAYLALNLLEWMIHGPARVAERSLAFNLSRNYLMETYHQTLHLPVKWHQDNHSGAIINRVRKAYEALKDFFQNGFMFFHAFAKFVFSFAAMLYFSPLFGFVGILLGAMTIWLIFKFDTPLIKNLNATNEKEHIVSSTLFDSLSNINTVITLRLEKQMEKSLLQRIKDAFPPFKKNVVLTEWKWFVADMLVALIYCVIAIGYVFQNWTPGNLFLVGGLVTLLAYVQQFTSVFHDIAWQYNQIIQYNTDVDAAKNIKQSFAEQHRPDKEFPLPENWDKISITNLNYSHQDSYTSTKAHSLHNVHLSLQKGKRIAMVGESGSGKSTLLALLRGLYEPEKGVKVLVDNKTYNSLGVLAHAVTLFPQEPEIFENTIRYNITLGLPFEEEEITRVCDAAQFSDVVQQLPNGFESNIKEKGVNLSGGQKQRLALARGILAAQNSDMVLMDEPTSSVDPKTEIRIYEQLFSAFEGKIVLSALHRLHLLTYFDYVYVLSNGRIVAEGSFADLKKTSTHFQELWKHQEEQRLVIDRDDKTEQIM